MLESLRETIVDAEASNPSYQEGARIFLELCHHSISPNVTNDNVREMLIQHILTKDIFLRVFGEDQFHRENNVARQLDILESTFFTGNVRRQAIDRLRAYYGAIGRAANDIAEYGEKQQFLKGIYEDFYQAYKPWCRRPARRGVHAQRGSGLHHPWHRLAPTEALQQNAGRQKREHP